MGTDRLASGNHPLLLVRLPCRATGYDVHKYKQQRTIGIGRTRRCSHIQQPASSIDPRLSRGSSWHCGLDCHSGFAGKRAVREAKLPTCGVSLAEQRDVVVSGCDEPPIASLADLRCRTPQLWIECKRRGEMTALAPEWLEINVPTQSRFNPLDCCRLLR